MDHSYPIERWLSDDQIAGLAYSSYWNDEELERAKEWYVVDGDFSKLERFLGESALVADLQTCLQRVRQLAPAALQGKALDLAAGVLWAERYLLAAGGFETIHCVEMSVHRLTRIGPVVLQHDGVPPERIRLAVGSFYDLRLPDASVNLVLLSAAFHHADEPARLLGELRRVLKPEGRAVLVWEHRVSILRRWPRHLARVLVSRLVPGAVQQALLGRRLDPAQIPCCPKTPYFYPTDPVLGDHYYSAGDYRRLFREAGFRHLPVPSGHRGFVNFILAPV